MCNPIPGCLPGTIFNNLSCGCYPDPASTICAAACSEYQDPRDPCHCIGEDELFSIFPSWADFEDIMESMNLVPAPPIDDDW